MSIIWSIMILSMLVYLLFLYSIYKGLGKLRNNSFNSGRKLKVSVIVPFRNEEDVVERCYNSIVNQNYPIEKFEVLFIDDNSTDASYSILSKCISKKNIKLLKAPIWKEERGFKKRVINFGIEQSCGDIILTSDADCFHRSDWISSMISNFDDETAFISGPVEFESDPSKFNKLQKLEFAGLIISGAGLIGIGKPTICNAANLAFRKNVFHEVGGYSDNLKLTSGDDEFLMQKIARTTNYKVKFSISQDSIVTTSANKDLNKFYEQRKRWASKSLFYIDKILILKLIFIMLYYLSFPSLLIFGIFVDPKFFIYLFLSFVIKSLIELLVLLKGKRIIFPSLDLSLFLLAELLHIPYIIFAGLSGLFGNYKWKDRKVKR